MGLLLLDIELFYTYSLLYFSGTGKTNTDKNAEINHGNPLKADYITKINQSKRAYIFRRIDWIFRSDFNVHLCKTILVNMWQSEIKYNDVKWINETHRAYGADLISLSWKYTHFQC